MPQQHIHLKMTIRPNKQDTGGTDLILFSSCNCLSVNSEKILCAQLGFHFMLLNLFSLTFDTSEA